MGTGYRLYLCEQDGGLRRISQRLAADLRAGRAALPEFAGSEQKIVSLTVETEGRKPQRLLEVQGQIWSFDQDGKIADSQWREHCARVDLFPGALGSLPSGVADLRPVLMRNKLEAETRWAVPDQVLETIAADLRRVSGPSA